MSTNIRLNFRTLFINSQLTMTNLYRLLVAAENAKDANTAAHSEKYVFKMARCCGSPCLAAAALNWWLDCALTTQLSTRNIMITTLRWVRSLDTSQPSYTLILDSFCQWRCSNWVLAYPMYLPWSTLKKLNCEKCHITLEWLSYA